MIEELKGIVKDLREERERILGVLDRFAMPAGRGKRKTEMSDDVIFLNSVGSALVRSTLHVYPVEANGHVIFDPLLGTPLENCEAEWVNALDETDWSLIADAAYLTEGEVAFAKKLAREWNDEPLFAADPRGND